MKKAVTFTLALALLLSLLAGCGAGTSPAPTSAPATSAPAATAAPASVTPAPVSEAPAAPKNRLEKILADGKIVVATSPDYAPYEFIDPSKSGQESYVGSEVELVKYVADKLGVTLVIDAMDFGAIQAAVATGQVDFAFGALVYTAERAESLEVSDYFNVSDELMQGLLVKKDMVDVYSTAESFAGKHVAAQNGTINYDLAANNLPDVIMEPVNSVSDGVLMLLSGKADALSIAKDNAETIMQSTDGIDMASFMFDYVREGNIFIMPKGETELRDRINEILKDINAQGLYSGWWDDAAALADTLGV